MHCIRCFLCILNKNMTNKKNKKKELKKMWISHIVILALFISCLLRVKFSLHLQVIAYVSQVHKVILPEGVVDNETVTLEQVQ